MPELRQNMATKQWVILAVERARRPEEYVQADHLRTEQRPEWDASCPFCVGREGDEHEVMRLPPTGPWQVRMLPNKYPALKKDGERVRTFDGVHRLISGVGHHELVVETPRHNLCAALDTPEHVAMTLGVLRMRARELAQDPRVEQIICFANHGERAGTSLVHAHTQIIALPVVPYDIRARSEEARRYFDDTGRCVFCQMLGDELELGTRIVAENQSFVALIPYAAFSPFHTWILPRQHRPSFLLASKQETADLGELLHCVLRKIYVGLNDPDYNYVIRTAPLHDPGYDYSHWYITLVPRVTRSAGFEMGSGMYINTALPEHSAAFLRAVRAD